MDRTIYWLYINKKMNYEEIFTLNKIHKTS